MSSLCPWSRCRRTRRNIPSPRRGRILPRRCDFKCELQQSALRKDYVPHHASFLLTVLGVTLSAASPYLAHAQTPGIQVTLLGTGSPRPSLERFGPSILVEAGTQKFLFDVGRGATQRLAQL